MINIIIIIIIIVDNTSNVVTYTCRKIKTNLYQTANQTNTSTTTTTIIIIMADTLFNVAKNATVENVHQILLNK